MQLLSTISALRERLDTERAAGRTVGLVPTMGYLHQGHMALAERAKRENDIVVLTIFVNPTQFGPNEDLATYPRDLPRDLDLCRAHGVDLVFAPDVAEIYPEPIGTHVEVEGLSDMLIGRHRPGHFRGVATVVTKLFHIAEPHRAYFGEKDFQQLTVIRRMARDLSFRTEIIGVATVREADGLAASSRNARLTPEDRAAAVVLSRALDGAERAARLGERSGARLLAEARALIEAEPRARLQSLDLCDAETLEPLESLSERPAVLLVTAHFGQVLLIDQRVLPLPTAGVQA